LSLAKFMSTNIRVNRMADEWTAVEVSTLEGEVQQLLGDV
jgi:hypothetical protein